MLSSWRNNLPSSKPELWQNVPNALRRRLVAWVSNKVDPGWGWRPLLATIEPDGLLLEVLPQEIGSRSIVYYGIYEYAPTQLVRSFLRPGDTFVDVGANIGYYSVVASALVGPRGRVVAFEPSARVRERLVRSASLNGFSQLEIRAEAVGATSGMLTLVEPESENQGLGFTTDDASAAGLRVRAVRLDDEPFAGSPVALVKVDIEGGESAVFEGARALLSRDDAPAILFESFQLERDRRLLDELGYDIYAPCLTGGKLGLRRALGAGSGYRAWEAPNYFAVRSRRGREFCAGLLVAVP